MEGNKIVVGLTTRGKDADKFWFSLFHELAHIILGHIGQSGGTTENDEEAADAWARDTLISRESFDEFQKNGDYSVEGVSNFARRIGVAAGIVVGRLQNEGCIKYNSTLNELKEKYEITG